MKWWQVVVVGGAGALAACVGAGGSGGNAPRSAEAKQDRTAQTQADEGASDEWRGDEGAIAAGAGEPFEPMTPNEMHRALEPCANRIGDAGMVRLEVDIDVSGNPTAARAIKVGGTVAEGLLRCAEEGLMRSSYRPRDGATTLAVNVHM